MRFSIRILLALVTVSVLGVVLGLTMFDRNEGEHLPTKLSKMGVYWFDYRDSFRVGLENRLTVDEMKTVAAVIDGHGKSCHLSIVYDHVMDADIAYLSDSTNVRTVYMAHTILTDTCLDDLFRIQGLKKLQVNKSPGITKAGLTRIKNSRPDLDISVDGIEVTGSTQPDGG